MIIKGELSEVSLAEIFHFLAFNYKTGLLTIHTPGDENEQRGESYYIWLERGCILALDTNADGQGLISKIEQRNWLSHQTITELVSRCPENAPLGMFMRAEDALTSEQLKVLFYAQVIHPVCGLFKLKEGKADFDPMATLPQTGMTGLNLSAARATLMGLRVLRDWGSLSDKLPATISALNRTNLGKPNFKLDILEREVWELAEGKISLEAIAENLSLTTGKVQQIAFRLMMAGLVVEVTPLSSNFDTSLISSSPVSVTPFVAQTNSDRSYLQNLFGMVQGKLKQGFA